jgi:hypothetical protein
LVERVFTGAFAQGGVEGNISAKETLEAGADVADD